MSLTLFAKGDRPDRMETAEFPAPMCHWCKLRLAEDFNRDADGFHCQAFPEGIPERILTSVSDHRQPYRGDKGLRFTPVDSAPKDSHWDFIFDVPKDTRSTTLPSTSDKGQPSLR